MSELHDFKTMIQGIYLPKYEINNAEYHEFVVNEIAGAWNLISEGNTEDKVRGVMKLEEIGANGYPGALMLLGFFYIHGEVLLKNTKRGVQLINKGNSKNVITPRHST